MYIDIIFQSLSISDNVVLRLTLSSVATVPSKMPSLSASFSLSWSSSSMTGSSVLANLLPPFFLPHRYFFFPPDPLVLVLLRFLKMKALCNVESRRRIRALDA